MTAQPEPSAAVHLRSPAHGFCDDDETRRLLRSRPPRPALAWAEKHLGGRVVSVRAMRGGTSSAVHRLTVDSSQGPRVEAVLRRYVRPELNQEEPGIASEEAEVLRFVEPLDVPTPRLLAIDPSGDEAGAPALLMSRLPGRVDWWPRDCDRWLRGLAEILPRIHACPLPSRPGVIRQFAPDRQRSYEPPPWARHPAVWEEAVEIFHGPAPDEAVVFIQRDFHPGNVLWRYGRVSGVVDWQAASIGPAALDVAHCRGNLLGYGPEVAERFTVLWQQSSGMTYHPWAEVVTVIGTLDDLREDSGGPESHLVEDLLARAVAELRGGLDSILPPTAPSGPRPSR